MSGEADLEAGRRFAADIRALREDRSISIDQIHAETKIAHALIEEFERTALLNQPQFNRVYLRSIVRTYASILELDTEELLGALDAALEGSYQNSLGVAYLGQDPLDVPDEEVEVAPSTDAPAEEESSVAAPMLSTVDLPVAPESRTTAAPPVLPDADALDPETLPPGSPPERGSVPRGMVIGAGIVLLAVVLLLGGRALLQEPSASYEAVPDTLSFLAPPSPVYMTLDDTLSATVIAALDKVDPIRVKVDDDLRRPHWLEQGEQKVFFFTEEVTFTSKLERIQLLIADISYPFDTDPDETRIVTRSGFETYLDSLEALQLNRMDAYRQAYQDLARAYGRRSRALQEEAVPPDSILTIHAEHRTRLEDLHDALLVDLEGLMRAYPESLRTL